MEFLEQIYKERKETIKTVLKSNKEITTFIQLAKEIGITRQTLNDFFMVYPEIRQQAKKTLARNKINLRKKEVKKILKEDENIITLQQISARMGNCRKILEDIFKIDPDFKKIVKNKICQNRRKVKNKYQAMGE